MKLHEEKHNLAGLLFRWSSQGDYDNLDMDLRWTKQEVPRPA